MMEKTQDWLGREIETVVSARGVRATVSPWDNLMRSGIAPWPPPEIIQKLYQSRHGKAFRGRHSAAATRHLGFYCDWQSLHSGDALTWSFWGPIVYAAPAARAAFVAALWQAIGIPTGPTRAANVWLWRRIPHPDTGGSGGPELDVGIQTEDTGALVEDKWLSPIAARQGRLGDKDQLTLRREFCEK